MRLGEIELIREDPEHAFVAHVTYGSAGGTKLSDVGQRVNRVPGLDHAPVFERRSIGIDGLRLTLLFAERQVRCDPPRVTAPKDFDGPGSTRKSRCLQGTTAQCRVRSYFHGHDLVHRKWTGRHRSA